MDTKQHLKRAIAMVGGTTKLAELIGVNQPVVSNWLHPDRNVPPRRAIDIEYATDGKVTREDLCPELFSTSVSIRRKRRATA